jgi:hypothetical protein
LQEIVVIEAVWITGAAGVAIAVVPGPVPLALVATTVNVYGVPLLKPVKVQLKFRVLVHEAGAVTEGEEVTEYPVIAAPPLEAGAVQEITD